MALAPAKASKIPVAGASRNTPAKANRVYVIPPRCNSDISGGVRHTRPRQAVKVEHGVAFDPNTLALKETSAQLRHFAHALQHDLQALLRLVVNQGEPDEETDKCNAYSMEGALRIEALLKALLAYLEITGFVKPYCEFDQA
jgi:hypothetical protein